MSKLFSTIGYLFRCQFMLPAIPFLCILITFKIAITDDGESKYLYESRRLQIKFLIQQTKEDSLTLTDILHEADYFAEEGDYQIALDLLDMATQYTLKTASYQDSASLSFNDLLLPLNFDLDDEHLSPTFWDISTEIGTDYSRNEYELSFLESDSLVLEELNKPYFSLRLSRSKSYQNRYLNFYNYNRIDADLIQTSFSLALESIDFEQNWRIEGRTNWFWFLEQEQGTFWENEARLNWNKLLNPKNRFYIQTNLRSKIYFPDNETYHNLFDGDLRLALRHNYQILHWLDISVRPSQFVEFSRDGLSYSQIQSQIEYHHRTDYNQYFLSRFNHYFRDFSSSAILENYHNQYHSLQPAVDFEWPLIFPLGLAAQADLDIRKYTSPDLTYSNFQYRRINLMAKFYFNVYNSFGIGYIHENENHAAENSADAPSVDLEDFFSDGLSLSLDILQLQGIMVSAAYSYILRTYPNAGEQDILSIYTNRKIHSIQAFGYLPVSGKWQVQFFVSYDNDRDRSRDNNDNLSTLFNISLQYHF